MEVKIVFCPDCGAENKDNAKFCKNCGASLNKAANQDNTLKSKVADSDNAQKASQVSSNIPQNAAKSSGNKNTLIICVTAIICVAIIAGAFILLNSNQSSDSDTVSLNDTETEVNSSDDSAKSTSSDSSSSNEMTFDEAKSYLSGASNTVISNTFDEADANGDGVLTGSEIDRFKYLADVTHRTADTGNTEHVEASDQGAGDGSTKTRYCTTHGRVAVGSDNLCPYCLEEGLDARTLKGSTEYI